MKPTPETAAQPAPPARHPAPRTHRIAKAGRGAVLALLAGVLAWPGTVSAADRFHAAITDPAAPRQPTPAQPGADRVQAPAATGLEAVQASGALRIALLREATADAALEALLERQRELAARAAKRLGLTPVWLPVDEVSQLQRLVRQGEADVGLAATPLRSDRPSGLASTLPVASVRYVVLTRAGALQTEPADTRGLAAETLRGRVGILESTPAWVQERLRSMMAAPASLNVLPATRQRESLLAELAAGRLDALVLSSVLFDPQCAVCDQVRTAFDLTPPYPLSFWVRAGNSQLRAALNGMLEALSPASGHDQARYRADLDEIKRRGVLRVITTLDPSGFQLRNGEPEGMEAGLLRRFADLHGLRLEYLVGDSAEQMVEWLKQGRADLIASRVAAPAADQGAGVVQSRAYAYDVPVLMARRDAGPTRPEELAGRRVALRADSPHQATLRSLRSAGVAVVLEQVPAGTDDRALVAGVAEGRYDLTVLSGNALPGLLRDQPGVQAALSLNEDRRFRWSVHGENHQLLGAVNAFFADAYRSAFLNQLTARYLHEAPAGDEAAGGAISPYDALARHYGERYDFDWRLVVAVMFEESGFDPAALSSAGARGLMQVMPATADELGMRDIHEPANGIHAGVAYLHYLRERFESTLPVAERTWFAIAAYHLGYARVESARRKAADRGLDPDRWSGNVERVMQSLSRGNAHARAYWRTVNYVRNIRSRYLTYVQVAERLLARAAAGAPSDRPG